MLEDNPTPAPKSRVRGQVYADFVFLVNPGWRIQNLPRDLLVEFPLETKADAELYIARLANIKPWSEQVIEALARAAQAGALPPRYVIDDTITYLNGLLKINGQDQPEAQILDIYTHFRSKIYQIRDIMDRLGEDIDLLSLCGYIYLLPKPLTIPVKCCTVCLYRLEA